jgi:hypothetical protein
MNCDDMSSYLKRLTVLAVAVASSVAGGAPADTHNLLKLWRHRTGVAAMPAVTA